jgi:hypothetical protein
MFLQRGGLARLAPAVMDAAASRERTAPAALVAEVMQAGDERTHFRHPKVPGKRRAHTGEVVCGRISRTLEDLLHFLH